MAWIRNLALTLCLTCALTLVTSAKVDEVEAVQSDAASLINPLAVVGRLDYQKVEYPVEGTTGLNPDAYVETSGLRFTIDGCDFVFSGANLWQAAELASNTQLNRGNPKPGREHLAQMMNRAVESGLKVLRLWAHTIVEGRELQPNAGTYNEEIFQGLDWINDEARKRGLKIIWIFADNWYDIGGIKGFEHDAAGGVPKRNQTFFERPAKDLYKQHIAVLLNRINEINGIRYKEDPTIMAWNLANELRCKGCPSWIMQTWIEEMCDWVKKIDPNHLVGVGYEGFYGANSSLQEHNPASWAGEEGQDFIPNHQAWCVDYVGFHVWPDNWSLITPQFQKDFSEQHMLDAEREIGKPVLMEEYGKIGNQTEKQLYFGSAHELMRDSVNNGNALRGDLFYHWYDDGIGPGRYGVWYADDVFQDIKAHAGWMNSKSGSDCTSG